MNGLWETYAATLVEKRLATHKMTAKERRELEALSDRLFARGRGETTSRLVNRSK